jgi:hypothetical protein
MLSVSTIVALIGFALVSFLAFYYRDQLNEVVEDNERLEKVNLRLRNDILSRNRTIETLRTRGDKYRDALDGILYEHSVQPNWILKGKRFVEIAQAARA